MSVRLRYQHNYKDILLQTNKNHSLLKNHECEQASEMRFTNNIRVRSLTVNVNTEVTLLKMGSFQQLAIPIALVPILAVSNFF